ncbi:hypothetical protein [Agrobacterium tumefaciens]|uniref:hypothetical protein n=1 Tax=Agrobacterium tumefaciens TaxID=358 RepID=UPI00287E8CE8|nr:hypothetical protein [Agrobacterium tumefaciens]MDS7594731.1 hypothetical protein [Agrobacterium tumefaciens]
MAVTIELTSASSDLVGFLNGWASGFSSTYGAFWDQGVGLVTNPVIGTTYEGWGNGSTGGKGIYFEGSVQYSQGNLTGTVDSIALGTGYSQSSSGFSLAQEELLITPDSAFPSATTDAFDLAIYQLSRFGSLTGFYDYFAATGTVLEDTASSDTLTGFAGADTFVFSGGNDIVTAGPTGTYGYQDGVDKLDISAWGATSLGDLTIVDAAGDAYVVYGSDSIQLVGVSSSVLDASDFIFASATALAA